MEARLSGRVWTFGDNISTDHIISGKYLGTTDPQTFAEHAMESVDPEFSRKVQRGDIIVAGRNFGSGSSREQAPVALKTLGIAAIVAGSFARIFFRNCINIGLPVVECPELMNAVEDGDMVQVDLSAGAVTGPSGEMYMFNPLPDHIMGILEAGGLVPKLRAELGGSED